MTLHLWGGVVVVGTPLPKPRPLALLYAMPFRGGGAEPIFRRVHMARSLLGEQEQHPGGAVSLSCALGFGLLVTKKKGGR